MERILLKRCSYEAPKCISLSIEQEGLLCASEEQRDGSHEAYSDRVDFTWINEL